jgi:hypothetical protein
MPIKPITPTSTSTRGLASNFVLSENQSQSSVFPEHSAERMKEGPSCLHRHFAPFGSSYRHYGGRSHVGGRPACPRGVERREGNGRCQFHADHRPQQRYDHRLRNLVQRTGDVTVATELGFLARRRVAGWARPQKSGRSRTWSPHPNIVPSRPARPQSSPGGSASLGLVEVDTV